MIDTPPDVSTTLFLLPPDAKFLPVAELSTRLRAKIGAVEHGHAVITRPAFRVTTRLVAQPLADLIAEFRAPSLLTDAIHRFARAHDQDPLAMLDLAFDALAALVDARILVPEGSPDAVAPTPSLAAGQTFAGFEIEALVRSLEDSEVYRARGSGPVPVALKIARDERPDIKAILANEARVLGYLRGADCPQLLANGIERGRAYIAMEWCEGVSIAVAAQQARAARDRRRLQTLVGRMLNAYGRLHEKGVLHGDIHTGNCLVRDDGRVVILDFGHAHRLDTATFESPRSGIPSFYDPQMAAALMSRELPPAATAASEQYSLGVLAYLLLTGLQPIEAPASHEDLLRHIVERPVLPFTARGVHGWPAVETVIARALSKHPTERFPDTSALSRAFTSAGVPRDRAWRAPRRARHAFDMAVEAALNLTPLDEPGDQGWFALRAALAMEDAELLAAADVLVRRRPSGWATQCAAAMVARARSDSRMESEAITGFLAAVDTIADRAETVAALSAAATLLEGSLSRAPEAAALAAWAARRIDEVMATVPDDSEAGLADPLLIFVSLSLARSGAVAVRPDLPARLDALELARAGYVSLWALAYDVLANEKFRSLALAAELPHRPLMRAFALLRRYQITGDPQSLRDARRVVARAPHTRLSAFDTALLVAELMAPERAVPLDRIQGR